MMSGTPSSMHEDEKKIFTVVCTLFVLSVFLLLLTLLECLRIYIVSLKRVRKLVEFSYNPAICLPLDQPECTMCLQNFVDNQHIYRTSCGHIYHKDCLSRWLSGHETCPICRGRVL